MKVSVIFGTRPEAIKLAPVILALRRDPGFECRICVTAQHRELLDQVLEVFEIKPDVDLNLMRPNQTLGGFTSRAIEAIDGYLAKEKPQLVLVQGDTTTVFCAALAAFYHHITIGHVEAGLRTGNLQAPWPEEANRVLTSRLAALHFAPTESSKENLLKEGVPSERIFVTGNTVIDALLIAVEKIRKDPPKIPGLPDFLQPASDLRPPTSGPPRMVLITGHRRENFGDGFASICTAIAELAGRFPDVHFVYPVHLNPNVREPVNRILGGGENRRFKNIHLLESLPYLPFVALLNQATLVLTDSGGIQEEAPSLGKPVLVMRETTERPEALQAGSVRLVGTDRERIVKWVADLLTDQTMYRAMARAINPYGDGNATPRIVAACKQILYSEPCSL